VGKVSFFYVVIISPKVNPTLKGGEIKMVNPNGYRNPTLKGGVRGISNVPKIPHLERWGKRFEKLFIQA